MRCTGADHFPAWCDWNGANSCLGRTFCERLLSAFSLVETGDSPKSSAVDSEGLKAEFRLPGKNFEDLGSLRIKPTFAEPFTFLSSSHSGCPYQSADFVALVPRKPSSSEPIFSGFKT
jgi:hypothetical protein